MSKKKPDYTKFMRSPAPLRLSPPSEGDQGTGPKPISLPKPVITEEEHIPWAEIVGESPVTAPSVEAQESMFPHTDNLHRSGCDFPDLSPGGRIVRGPRPEDIEYLEKLPYPSLPQKPLAWIFGAVDAPPFGVFLFVLVLLLVVSVAGLDPGP